MIISSWYKFSIQLYFSKISENTFNSFLIFVHNYMPIYLYFLPELSSFFFHWRSLLFHRRCKTRFLDLSYWRRFSQQWKKVIKSFHNWLWVVFTKFWQKLPVCTVSLMISCKGFVVCFLERFDKIYYYAYIYYFPCIVYA